RGRPQPVADRPALDFPLDLGPPLEYLGRHSIPPRSSRCPARAARSCTHATTLRSWPQPSRATRSPAGPRAAPPLAIRRVSRRRMAPGSEPLAPGLPEYLVSHSTPPDALLRDLISETAERFPDRTGMQIGREQGTFMTMLAGLMGARHAVEVGTFT